MTDKNVSESKASGEQPSDDLTALSVPSLRTALSFLVASVAVLYPFGLLIFERQLQFAYALDTPTAWHAVTVISQIEVVLHGLQVLAAPRTIQFGVTFIVFVVTIGLLSRTTYAYLSVKRMAKNLWKTKRQYKWDPWANFTASQLEDMVRSTERKLASLHVQLAERHAQEHVTTDRIDSLRHELKGIEGRSSEPIEDLIRRIQVVSLRQQLNEECQTLETTRTLITSTEKAIAHQQKTKPVFQEALAAKIMDATPSPDIKQETLSLPWRVKLMLWAVPSLLLALVGYQSLVQPPTILDKILALLLVVPTSSIGTGLAYRHFQLSDDNYLPPSTWLLWSAIFGYVAALILAYFSTTASPNGLLPFATVSTRNQSVCGALLNVSDFDWYIIQSPRLNTLCRPSRPTLVAQVMVVFNFETTGVVFGLPPGMSMHASASVRVTSVSRAHHRP